MIRHSERGVFFYDMADTEAKHGGTKPQIAIYQQIASRQDEIITKLFDLLSSRNESVAVSAAKTLLNKILPDLRSTEITGKDGEPIKLNIITGADFSQLIKSSSTSTGGSSYGSSPIQSVSVAQTGEENDDSNQSVSEVDSA